MRFKSKSRFLDRVRVEWDRLWLLLDQADGDALATRVVWGVDRTVKDALMRVHEWHRMNLRWYRNGLTGTPEMPAKGYTWLECPKLNQAIFERHRDLPLAEAKRRLRRSHTDTLALLETLSDAELLTPGYFKWCGKGRPLPLTSYFHANTSSHYRWAQDKVKRLLKPPPSTQKPRETRKKK